MSNEKEEVEEVIKPFKVSGTIKSEDMNLKVIREESDEPKKERDLFGWIFHHREMLVVHFLKVTFLIGISLLYLAVAITFYDVLFKWLMVNTVEIDFAWKTLIFGLGLGVMVFGFTLLVYVIMVAYYLKFFKWFEARLEWIDHTKTIRE